MGFQDSNTKTTIGSDLQVYPKANYSENIFSMEDVSFSPQLQYDLEKELTQFNISENTYQSRQLSGSITDPGTNPGRSSLGNSASLSGDSLIPYFCFIAIFIFIKFFRKNIFRAKTINSL